MAAVDGAWHGGAVVVRRRRRVLAAVMINAVVVVLEINHSAKLLQAKGVMVVEGESLAF